MATMRRAAVGVAMVFAGCAEAPRPEPAAPPEPAVLPAVQVEPTPAPAPPQEPAPSAPPRKEPAQPAWRPPWPALDLSKLSGEQQERARWCIAQGGADKPKAAAHTLAEAAQCLGEIPAPGREIQLYYILVVHHPEAPETQQALVIMAKRYEQVGREARALPPLEAYLKRYPKAENAPALGKRAVCLAWALEDEARVERLLDQLDRYYRRRGFERPSPSELSALCGSER